MEELNIKILPPGVLVHTLSYLDPQRVALAGATCRMFYRASRNQTLWKQKFVECFPDTFKCLPSESISDWYLKFQESNKKYAVLTKEEYKLYSRLRAGNIQGITFGNVSNLCRFKQIFLFMDLPNRDVANHFYRMAVEYYSDGPRLDTAKTNRTGMTILHWAIVFRQSVETIESIILQNGNVNQSYSDGVTSLCISVNQGELEIARLLLDRGANIEATLQNGNTALSMTAYYGYLEVVRLLLDRGANIEAAINTGATVLYVAAQQGHDKVVGLLLKRGANIETARHTGATALYMAAQKGHLKVVKLLLAYGANVNVSGSGGTVLELAKKNGRAEVVKALLIQMVTNYLRTVVDPKKPNKKFSLFPSVEYSEKKKLAAGNALLQAIFEPENLAVLRPHENILNDKNELKFIYNEFKQLLKSSAARLEM